MFDPIFQVSFSVGVQFFFQTVTICADNLQFFAANFANVALLHPFCTSMGWFSTKVHSYYASLNTKFADFKYS